MHVVICKYTASPDVIAETQRNMENLEETMRSIPGFAAYYFIETGDGLQTITVTEDEAGIAESMAIATRWIEEHTPNHSPGAPEVIEGHTPISATQ
jgi:quinol monooxygenase YgiN